MMADESDNEEYNLANARRKRIKELVQNIAGHKRKKQKTEKDQLMENPKKKQRGAGRHPTYKLHLGWLHETRGKFRQVTARRGGGTRIYEFNKEENQTVETVISYATHIFFPEGKNDMGNLSDMEVNLSTYNGEVISKFLEPNGEECDLQTYLKSIGVFSSQYYLYLRTSKKKETEARQLPDGQLINDGSFPAPLLSLKVNNQTPGELRIQYTKLYNSAYTSELSEKICHSIDDCFLDTVMTEPDIERKGFNPLEYNFKITGVTVNDITILSRADPSSNHFEYPTATSDTNGIIHTPGQIAGFENSENKELILGVLYKEHNSGAYFNWFRNMEPFASGTDLCLVTVNDPGEYLVRVSNGDTLYECSSVRVDSQILLTEPQFKTNSSQEVQETVTEPRSLVSLKDSPVITNNTHEIQKTVNVPESLESLKDSPVVTNTSYEIQKTDNVPGSLVSPKDSPVVTNTSHEIQKTVNVPGSLESLKDSPVVTNTSHEIQKTVNVQESLESLKDSPVVTNTSHEIQKTATDPGSLYSNKDSSVVTNTNHEIQKTVTEPGSLVSLKDSPVVTNTSPEIEETFTEPRSLYSHKVSSVVTNHGHMPQVIVTEPANPSHDFIKDNAAVNSSHEMHKSVIEQTRSFKDLSMATKCSPANMLNLSTNVNVPEIPYDNLCMGPKIGEGAFGTVHMAHWLFTPVAVKTVKIRRMKLAQKAIEREVNILSRVRHPNIIMFMGYSIYDNKLHIVSEYIQGSNLDDLLFGDECQKIPLSKKCHIAEKLTQAVAYLHNSSPIVLHRDLKPENIILSESLETVKLCDLGISKLLTINSSATTYAPGMQPGTLIFQAPEILLGNTPASTKSDVWGMAGTLAELFSESPIWGLQEEDEEDEISTVERIKIFMSQKEIPHAIRKLSQMDGICSTVVDIVTKGLNYDPDSRPAAIEFPTKFNM